MVKVGKLVVEVAVKGSEKAKSQLRGLGDSVKKFGLLSKAAFALAAIAVANFAKNMASLRFQMQSTEGSFKSLASHSLLLRKQLRQATLGMISDIELMGQANNALVLGLEENQLADLFRNAAIVAKATGRTTTEAISDVTTGIGRQSRLILDNLGIIVKAEEANKDYATSIGKTANQLTEAEKRIAFTNAAMNALNKTANQLKDSVGDLVDPTQEAAASWQNFKVEISRFVGVAAAPLLNILGGISKTMADNLQANKAGLQSQKLLTKAFNDGTLTYEQYNQQTQIANRLAMDGISIQDALTESLQRQNIARREQVDNEKNAVKERSKGFEDDRRNVENRIKLLNEESIVEKTSFINSARVKECIKRA